MIYEKLNPDQQLEELVHCYYHWEQDTEGKCIRVQRPPSGYEAIVFNLGDRYRINTLAHKSFTTTEAFYSGQHTGNYEMHLTGKIKVFGVVLLPGAFASLFRVSVKGTVDRRIPLQELLNTEADSMIREVTEVQGKKEWVRIMNKILLEKLWISQLHADPVDKAARLIAKHNGMISLQELVDDLGCSRRTLQRKFIDKTGVSPKMLARICRFSHMSYLLMYRKADWQELVYEGGYSDQSHFIKDFQYFNRQKPTEYLQQHQELIKYLK